MPITPNVYAAAPRDVLMGRAGRRWDLHLEE